jgi:hypothetical protein
VPTHDPGRTVLRCPGCQATLAYLSTAAVKRAAAMAGFGLFAPEHAVKSVANAGALRCVSCEAAAVNAAAVRAVQYDALKP